MEENKGVTIEYSKKIRKYKVSSLSLTTLSAIRLTQSNVNSILKASATITTPMVDSILKEMSMISASTKPLVEHVLKEAAMLSDMRSTLTKLAMSYTQSLSELSNACRSMITLFSQIDYKPLLEIQCILPSLELDDIYLKELCKAKWFPVRIMMESTSTVFFTNIINVINATKTNSKSRIKKLDKIFIDYYDKNTLKGLKKSWKTLDNIPPHIKRILSETIEAYKRRQYVLTVSALVTLWQGIIQEKTIGKQEGKSDDKTCEEFNTLITANDCSNFVKYYFDEYIFYTCYGIEQVKDDVPGRHMTCHSWYKKYPTRKTALNAILFTEFLLGLSPVNKEQKNDGKTNDDV